MGRKALLQCEVANLSETFARQILTPADRVQSRCVLAARNGNAADTPCFSGAHRRAGRTSGAINRIWRQAS